LPNSAESVPDSPQLWRFKQRHFGSGLCRVFQRLEPAVQHTCHGLPLVAPALLHAPRFVVWRDDICKVVLRADVSARRRCGSSLNDANRRSDREEQFAGGLLQQGGDPAVGEAGFAKLPVGVVAGENE